MTKVRIIIIRILALLMAEVDAGYIASPKLINGETLSALSALSTALNMSVKSASSNEEDGSSFTSTPPATTNLDSLTRAGTTASAESVENSGGSGDYYADGSGEGSAGNSSESVSGSFSSSEAGSFSDSGSGNGNDYLEIIYGHGGGQSGEDTVQSSQKEDGSEEDYWPAFETHTEEQNKTRLDNTTNGNAILSNVTRRGELLRSNNGTRRQVQQKHFDYENPDLKQSSLSLQKPKSPQQPPSPPLFDLKHHNEQLEKNRSQSIIEGGLLEALNKDWENSFEGDSESALHVSMSTERNARSTTELEGAVKDKLFNEYLRKSEASAEEDFECIECVICASCAECTECTSSMEARNQNNMTRNKTVINHPGPNIDHLTILLATPGPTGEEVLNHPGPSIDPALMQLLGSPGPHDTSTHQWTEEESLAERIKAWDTERLKDQQDLPPPEGHESIKGLINSIRSSMGGLKKSVLEGLEDSRKWVVKK